MTILIYSISLIAIIATAMTVVLKLRKLSNDIKKAEEAIEVQHYYTEVAQIAKEHVNDSHLMQIKEKAETAIRNAQHLDGFSEYVRPVLQSIIDDTKKLTEDGVDADKRQILGDEIERNSTKLTNVIENVLLMARINSDNINCEMQNCSVEDIVVPVYESFQGAKNKDYCEVERKGEVSLSIGKGIPMTISCDKIHLEKVLTEVVKNAYQFIEQGNIQMGWFYKMESNEVEIFIEDNGIGIKDEQREQIFEPFFKGCPTYTGVGIGLTIAKALVKKMGGEIRVISRGDFGTRISIIFQRVK